MALSRLLANPTRHPFHFRRVLAHAARHGDRLRVAIGGTGSGLHMEGASESHPVAAALLRVGPSPIPLQATLGWLLLELHLTGINPDLVTSISQWMRGIATSRNDNKLIATMGDCLGLEDVIARVEALKARTEVGQIITGHQDFDRRWHNSLSAAIHGLLRYRSVPGDGVDDRGSAELGSPEARPTTNPGSEWAEDPDDEARHDSAGPISDASVFDSLPARRASAFSQQLYRGSNPELLRAPDTILPRAIAIQAWNAARKIVLDALQEGDIDRAERSIIHLLAIETGLSEREVPTLAFGNQTRGSAVLDMRARALRRPELRPADSFRPPTGSESIWLDTGGDVLFPVSDSVLVLASVLLRTRRRHPSRRASSLLVSTQEPVAILRNAIAEAGLSGTVRASDYRLRLASTLAEKLGPDAAQVAFGDTFGLSAAPTYYCKFQSASIAEALASCIASISGQPAASPRTLARCGHWLGSRVRPRIEPYRETWQSFGIEMGRSRGRPSFAHTLEIWRRRRDCLAIHLLLATGHRPHQSLAEISLSDFLPRAGLALIHDKRSDPARMTRLVATGARFVGALEQFVDELRRISREPTLGNARAVARSILKCETSIFSLPADLGGAEALDVEALVAQLPSPWRNRPNLHRHALNHALIDRGTDSEHRYFQMGWLDGEIHAVSDAAPYPPQSLGPALQYAIDDWLQSIGWGGGREPEDRDSIFKDVCLRDLGPNETAHKDAHGERVHELRVALAERRQVAAVEINEQLLRKLEELVPSVVPSYTDGRRRTLRLKARWPDKERPRIDDSTVDEILSPFYRAPFSPIHAFLAPRMLSAILHRAVKEGHCLSALPRVRYLTASSVPSPFVAGLGLAVEFATRLRKAIQNSASTAGSLAGAGRTRRLAVLLSWALLSHTSIRKVGAIGSLLRSLAQSQHSKEKPWLIRLPVGEGHIAISGVPALLASRLQKEPNCSAVVEALLANLDIELGRFLRTEIPDLVPEGISAGDGCKWMITALRISGAVELNGPERLMMTDIVRPASVTAIRASSAEDSMSVPDETAASEGIDEQEDVDLPTSEPRRPPGRPSMRGTERVRSIMRLFNPDYDGLVDDTPAKPAEHRASQLRPFVEQCLVELSPTPTLGLLVMEYVDQLLNRGGPRTPDGMRISTIYKIYHRISPTLASIPPDRDTRELTTEEWSTVICSALLRARAKDKVAVLDDVRKFLDFAGRNHAIAEPDWDLTRQAAGEAIRGKDPAVVSDAEIERVLAVAAANIGPHELAGVDPADRRVRELQLATALLLDASGVRPRSIFGLTLADIHFTPFGDFIHLKSSGAFASIKTRTAAGFVPLEGRHWQIHRAWFADWHVGLLKTMHEHDLQHIPLFQVPNGPIGQRVPLKVVTGRIGELLRWSTSQSRGRTYWLRKRRIGARHAEAYQGSSLRARNVYRALKISGHVSIATPIASYIGDPSVYLVQDERIAEATTRTAASAYSGVENYVLDQRWRRAEKKIGNGVALSPQLRLSGALLPPPPQWPELQCPEPPPYKPWRTGLSWKAIEHVMANIALGRTLDDINLITGVDPDTIERIFTRIRELEVRTGLALGSSRPSLRKPRDTAAARAFRSFVENEDDRLHVIASDWVQCARIRPIEDGCVLIDPNALGVLRAVLQDVGLSANASEMPGVTSAIVPMPSTGKDYGTWPALRWTLSVAWVATGVVQKPN